MADVDPQRCPLCGDDNACGMAAGKTRCWCFEESVSPEVLERVPAEARDRACVCRGCASGAPLANITIPPAPRKG